MFNSNRVGAMINLRKFLERFVIARSAATWRSPYASSKNEIASLPSQRRVGAFSLKLMALSVGVRFKLTGNKCDVVMPKTNEPFAQRLSDIKASTADLGGEKLPV